MSQKGISFRLNTHVTTIAIVIIASIVYINYHFTKQILVDQIEEGAVNQSNLVMSRIMRVSVGTEEIARNVSHQALYYSAHNDLQLFLDQVLASNKIIESIHVELFDRQNQLRKFSSNKFGQLICNPDSTDSERYLNSLVSRNDNNIGGIWSNPFYCKYDTSQLLVSYKFPVYIPETSKIAGVVSCEISLRAMRKMLSEIQIGKSAYAFIIDKAGVFITHPKNEWVLHRNLFEKPSRIFSKDLIEIESKIKSGIKGSGHGISNYLNNKPCWYYFAPLASSGWTVIIVFPEEELYGEIEWIFKKIILVSGFGILFIFLLNIFIFRQMLDPLARVTRAIQRFSSVPGKERNSKNEILMLAESLEDWQSKYGLLINERDRTADEKLKFEKDLKSARDIQFNIIPSGKPRFIGHPEIDLFAILKPSEIVGGDLYDYFFIDNNHLLLAIGDVSGKGIPASLFMAIASTLIKSNAKVRSAKEIISHVNNELSDRNSNQYFVTLFIGIIDVKTGVMEYCNAAHNYPYLLHADGKIEILTKSHGLPLGIYKDKTYKSSSIELQNGDLLLMYTDGVINSRDASDRHFGSEKLEEKIQHLTDLTAEQVVTSLVKDILDFEGSFSQADDITLMALKYQNANNHELT